MAPSHQIDPVARTWSSSNGVAVALIVAGVVTPLVLTAVIRSIWAPLAEAIGLAVAIAGVALVVVRAGRDARHSSNVVATEMRSLTARMTRHVAQVDVTRNELAALAKTVDGERTNVGRIAGGLGEMRQIVRLERQNLGMLADGVDEIRAALASLHDAHRQARTETQTALSRLDELKVQIDAALRGHDELRDEIGIERRNLGLVAGALDDLRRLTTGVHRFDARQAAFEDALIVIADRIDQLGTGDAVPGEPGEAAGRA